MKRILLAMLLALILAFSFKTPVRLYEDGSVGFFDVPGWGFCISGQLCDKE